MHHRTPHTETEIDARDLRVRFSPSVKETMHTLAEAARQSEHFDREMSATLEDWSGEKRPTVHEVMISLPLIAEQAAEHMRTENNAIVTNAWRDLCTQMPEEGFSISRSRARAK